MNGPDPIALEGIAAWHERRAAEAPTPELAEQWRARAAAFRSGIGRPAPELQRIVDGEIVPATTRALLPEIQSVKCKSADGNTLVVTVTGELGLGCLPDDWEIEAQRADKVVIEIDCLGGSAFAAANLWARLAGLPNTHAIIRRAFSAASIVAMAGKRRSIYADGQMMVHGSVAFAAGCAEELRVEASTSERFDGVLARLFAIRTGQSIETVRGWLSKDSYFSPTEAIRWGLADEILP